MNHLLLGARQTYTRSRRFKSYPRRFISNEFEIFTFFNRRIESPLNDLQSMKDRRVIDCLLEENQPAVRYFTLIDLLGRHRNDSDVREAYSKITRRGWAFNILRSQKGEGYWESAGSLYRPKYTATNWMSLILSDLGLTNENRQVTISSIFSRSAPAPRARERRRQAPLSRSRVLLVNRGARRGDLYPKRTTGYRDPYRESATRRAADSAAGAAASGAGLRRCWRLRFGATNSKVTFRLGPSKGFSPVPRSAGRLSSPARAGASARAKTGRGRSRRPGRPRPRPRIRSRRRRHRVCAQGRSPAWRPRTASCPSDRSGTRS